MNIWQEDIEKIPIVTPKFNEGLIKVIATNNREVDKMLMNNP